MGLKRGDLSSPIMFNIYINELCSYIKQNCSTGIFVTNYFPEIYCLLFANDVANCTDTAVNFQNQSHTIDTFCTEIMEVKLKKSKLMYLKTDVQ